MSFVERNTNKWLNSTASASLLLTVMRSQEVTQALPAALYSAVDSVREWTGAPQALFKGLPGKRKYPPQEIPYTVEAVATYVSENLALTGLEDIHLSVFNLQDTATTKFTYALDWSDLAHIDNPGLHRIQVYLASGESYSGPRVESGEFARFFGRLAGNVVATQAFIYETRIQDLFVSPRAFHEAIKARPIEEHERIAPLLMPEDPELYLPQILYEQEIDLRMAPKAVWWINYWNQTIVDNIGRGCILAAPWAGIHEMPEGALLLEVTRDRLDVSRRDHCQRLREICAAIDLIGVQERFRLK
jgi:hypothetical protein